MEFCKQFNARTQDKPGKVLPAVITVYSDKSFDFVIKTPPAAVQLMEAAKLKKGSPESNRSKVGKVSWDQVRVIAEDKMPDLNCFSVESAMRMVGKTGDIAVRIVTVDAVEHQEGIDHIELGRADHARQLNTSAVGCRHAGGNRSQVSVVGHGRSFDAAALFRE